MKERYLLGLGVTLVVLGVALLLSFLFLPKNLSNFFSIFGIFGFILIVSDIIVMYILIFQPNFSKVEKSNDNNFNSKNSKSNKNKKRAENEISLAYKKDETNSEGLEEWPTEEIFETI